MTRPEHVDPKKEERRSKAPYNFIPLPKAVLRAPEWSSENLPAQHDRYIPGRYTGWIDVTVRAETPLFIRCAPAVQQADDSDPKTNIHRRQFFHRGDESRPVIPGSSMRGMIRTLAEIVSYSKIQDVSRTRLVYRAVGDPSSLGEAYREKTLGPNQSKSPDKEMCFEYPIGRLKGGYLEREGSQWFIRPAQVHEGESFVHVDYEDVKSIIDGQGRQLVHDIYVLPAKRNWSDRGLRGTKRLFLNLAIAQGVSFESQNGYVHAKLVESGDMPGGSHPKHMHCAIYDPDLEAKRIRIPFDLWTLYQEDLAISRGEHTETRHLCRSKDPLFYLLDDNGELVFFGPTKFFRFPYHHTVESYVPECLKHPDDIDLAEAIFGTVRSRGNSANPESLSIKGRVFFEDIIWDGQDGDPFLPGSSDRTPRILSSPKPTAFQHYLVQPEPNDRLKLRHYDSGPGATEIRGHKLYWHKRGVRETDMFEDRVITDTNDKQHTVIRPVRPGTSFKGRIRFENLSDIELGLLLSAINLPPSMRHKLGMGKPYGMGTVKTVGTLRLVDHESRYKRVCTDDGNLELGLKGNSETTRLGEACLRAFNNLIRAHDEERVPGNDDGTMWSIPRIAQLRKMLEWNDAPLCAETEYVGLDKAGATWWRQRRVLPAPGSVTESRGDTPSRESTPISRQTTTPPMVLKSGTKVRCVLLEEKTKKGGWKASITGSDLKGHILPGNEPPDIKAGDQVELVIHSTNPNNLSFRWPKH